MSLTAVTGRVDTLHAQVPTEGEVRQLVTFHFLPRRYAEAIDHFREQALPLYQQNEAMLSFRGFREVESPVPLDLVVVSAFRGMAGMDDSNASLHTLAERAGTSLAAIYGEIGALSQSHTDQFVDMLGQFTNGDPTSKALVALVWYGAADGQARPLLRRLERNVLPWERSEGIPSATGRFLVSDGWDYLRFIGFDSLGDYHDYWSRATPRVDDYTALRRQVILAPIPELSVR